MNPTDKVWADSDLVMISALEHWSYCPRQCALIHLEQTFDENIYTLRGRMLHERAHEFNLECRPEVRIERGLAVWSDRLGLVGKADVVEFRGRTPYPIEYKHGRKRRWVHPALQVCAQAMCLEEMTGELVPMGAIFYQGSRRRLEVSFDSTLRWAVEESVRAIRQMLASAALGMELPPAVNDARCRHCSLRDSCLPSVVAETRRIRALQTRLFQASGSAEASISSP